MTCKTISTCKELRVGVRAKLCVLCRIDRLGVSHTDSASAGRVGQRELGGITCSVLCTWPLLGLVVKGPWLAGWANCHPNCVSRLRKCHSHSLWGSFLAGKSSWAPSRSLPIKSADLSKFVNEWAWFRSQVCLLSLKVNIFWGESSDRNEDTYGVSQACVC